MVGKGGLRAGGRRLATLAGLEVRRRGRGPRRTLTEVLEHYRGLGVAPSTVVDVGVAFGTPDLYAAFPGSRLLLVDPLEEWEARMQEIVGRAPAGSAFEVCAAGANTGEIELSVHRALVCSSTAGDRAGEDEWVEKRTVAVRRLDEVVEEKGLAGGPFAIKVDVEGAELQVLEGAPETLSRSQLVLLEVSLFELNAGGAQLAEVVGWMAGQGWAVADIYNGHLRPLDGQLAQVDIAFARDDGPLRRSHGYASREQAEALYGSWGL